MGNRGYAPNLLSEAVTQVRNDLKELEDQFNFWQNTENINGSRKVRGIAKRIVLSAKRVEGLVQENSFSR